MENTKSPGVPAPVPLPPAKINLPPAKSADAVGPDPLIVTSNPLPKLAFTLSNLFLIPLPKYISLIVRFSEGLFCPITNCPSAVDST